MTNYKIYTFFHKKKPSIPLIHNNHHETLEIKVKGSFPLGSILLVPRSSKNTNSIKPRTGNLISNRNGKQIQMFIKI